MFKTIAVILILVSPAMAYDNCAYMDEGPDKVQCYIVKRDFEQEEARINSTVQNTMNSGDTQAATDNAQYQALQQAQRDQEILRQLENKTQ